MSEQVLTITTNYPFSTSQYKTFIQDNLLLQYNQTYTINNVRQLRADFGSYLLLGLEFLIASDILKTVVDPTLDELAILGGVVIVRTVLSVFLNKEIKELAEEENSKST